MAKTLYWDTSVFLCFLNPAERDRRLICEDILQNAQKGEVRLVTSTYTVVETIRPKKVSIPNARLLTADEINEIEKMFRWSWIEKVPVDQQIGFRAVQLARDHGLFPPDAIHAATAIRKRVDELQAWDRDFSSVEHLITVRNPTMISQQMTLIQPAPIGPAPESFKSRP